MDAGGLKLDRIGQIAVTVNDVAAARDFYRDMLGMAHLFDAPGLSFFQCGEVRLMLAEPESAEFDHPSSILYFRVDDLEAAHATLQERGVEFRHGPSLIHRAEDHELWMAFFRDGFGNTLGLMTERPAAGSGIAD